jgi:hypothetical protein
MFGAGICSSPSNNANVFTRRRPRWPPQASQTRICCGRADAPPPGVPCPRPRPAALKPSARCPLAWPGSHFAVACSPINSGTARAPAVCPASKPAASSDRFEREQTMTNNPASVFERLMRLLQGRSSAGNRRHRRGPDHVPELAERAGASARRRPVTIVGSTHPRKRADGCDRRHRTKTHTSTDHRGDAPAGAER